MIVIVFLTSQNGKKYHLWSASTHCSSLHSWVVFKLNHRLVSKPEAEYYSVDDPCDNDVFKVSENNPKIITARKRSEGKVMFLHLSVIPFTGVCVYPSMQWVEVYTSPWEDGVSAQGRQRSPRQTPPRQTLLPRDGHWSGWYASYWNEFLLLL